MYDRILNFDDTLIHRSIFLLGARQTGKSTLLKQRYPNARYIDLLHADTFRNLSSAPETLRQSLLPEESLVIIDEVQKLPALLDEVHSMIETKKDVRFILTGSSARKLKRSGVNMLAGRAHTFHLLPLTWPEAGVEFLQKKIQYGSLPSILDSPFPWRDLREYVGVYLQEEIRAESLTRSIEAFSRFLTVAGLANGKQLNFTKIGNDAQVPSRTIREFFSVLEDTLIGFQIPAYRKTKIRKPVATSKFYLFDIGVAHALQGTKEVMPGTAHYGETIEHLIATELRGFLSYHRIDLPLSYWRSTSQYEVDFIIGDSIAIEVKATGRIGAGDLKGLRALQDDLSLQRKIIVCNEERKRTLDSGIEIFPVTKFLDALWKGEIVTIPAMTAKKF